MKYFVPSSLFTRLFIGALLIALSAPFAQAYVAVDFTNEMNGRSAAYAGSTNVKLGEFTGPTPATDTRIHNGATAVIAAGNALTAFASSERYIDTNDDVTFDSGEMVVTSANSTLDSSDTVVTGATGALTAIPTSEALGTPVFLDADADTIYDSNENIAKIIVSGSAATLASGNSPAVFPLADNDTEESIMFIRSGTTRFNPDAPDAILQYEYRGEGDSVEINAVLRSGSVGFTQIDENDGVCLSDADTNGSYTFGEKFWYDIAGTCETYNTGVDISLTSEGTLTTPNIKFSDIDTDLVPINATLGYSDADADGLFDCTRGAICEQIMYIGGSRVYPTGQNIVPGNPVGFINYDIVDVVDGAGLIAEAPSRVDADPDLVNFVYLDKALGGNGVNKRYSFVDADVDGLYDAEEDIIEGTNTGTDVGSSIRLFSSGYTFLDLVTDNDEFEDGEPIFLSADTNLDAGVLSGAGTDDLIVASSSGFLTSFASTEKYHDHNTSGAYADGDDVVSDTDGSGYYNADDLLTIQFANSATDHPIGNDDLDNLYLYRRVGGSCGGSGIDTLLGSIATTPFFETNITVTDSVFTSATNYCVYADFLAGADAGEYLTLELSQNAADYASTGTSPSNGDVDFSLEQYYVSVNRFMDATLEAASVEASATTSYTATFTTSAELNSGDIIRVVFDEDNDISGAAISCTDDGAASAGTSSISAPVVTHTLSTTIAADSDVVCIVTGVENPSTAAAYSDFQVYTARDVDFGTLVGADADTTLDPITFTPRVSTGRGRSSGSSIPAPGVTLTSPTHDTTIEDPVRITWNASGRSVTDANLLYTIGDARYYIARNIPNSGAYTWDIPSHLSGKELTLTVELTDLVTVLASSSIDVTVEGEALPENETPRSASTWQIPNLSAHLVKVATSPTVFYLGPDNLLRAFFNEALFKTWQLTFGDIRTISFDELSQYQLGSGMVPLPGTVLVKSPIDAKVYVLEPNDLNPAQPILHWITSEEVATAYFGTNWASMIIDVTPSIIVMSIHGEDLDDPMNPPWYIELYK